MKIKLLPLGIDFAVILAILIFGIISCRSDKQQHVLIDFESASPDSSSISFHQDEAIHVAIASMSSPREGFLYYNELLQHISGKIGIPIHQVQKDSYEEVNLLLEEGAIDFAFISTGAYINAKEKGIVDLLVAPTINENSKYKSYIICNKSIRIANSINNLKGLDFAFSDPLSHSGYYYPIYLLKQLGLNHSSFFNKSVLTYGHDLSIQMVNRGVVDAAAVNGLIYDYLTEFSPQKIINTKIVETSDFYGNPPIVIPKNIDRKRLLLYRNIFVNLHKDKHGKEILKKLNIDSFSIVGDGNYNGIRLIKEAIKDEIL